jgi:hypothetical protein
MYHLVPTPESFEITIPYVAIEVGQFDVQTKCNNIDNNNLSTIICEIDIAVKSYIDEWERF